jgi:hypothetical protein
LATRIWLKIGTNSAATEGLTVLASLVALITHKHLTIRRESRRMGLWLQQAEDIRAHLLHRYSVTVNQVIMATVKLSRLWLQLNHQELLGQWLLFKQQPSIKEIMVGTTIFRCMSNYEADLDVSVVLFISSSIA